MLQVGHIDARSLFDPQFYPALRLRYVAQADLKDASATSDRFLSVVAALVSQF